MKVLQIIRKEFIKNQPLKGIRISACLHVTAETANLHAGLAGRRRRRGALRLQSRSPRRTTWPPPGDATTTFRCSPSRARTTTPTTSTSMRRSTTSPQITMDDGADLVIDAAHQAHRTCSTDVIGGTEETTTGVIRLRAMAKEGVLQVSRSSRSTTPDTSTCSTTATAPASPRSTASSAPPTSCWPDRSSSSPATAGAARARHARARDWAPNVIVTEIDPIEGARSRHGRLPRDAHERSRQDRRRLLHRDRQQERADARSTST